MLIVAGACPNFMKVAPILRALAAEGHEGPLVYTGQHYDARMSDAFFRDLELPEPDHQLGVGSGSHAQPPRRGGGDEDRIAFVGNVMIDTLLRQLPKARELDVPGRLGHEPAHRMGGGKRTRCNARRWAADTNLASLISTARAPFAIEDSQCTGRRVRVSADPDAGS